MKTLFFILLTLPLFSQTTTFDWCSHGGEMTTEIHIDNESITFVDENSSDVYIIEERLQTSGEATIYFCLGAIWTIWRQDGEMYKAIFSSDSELKVYKKKWVN